MVSWIPSDKQAVNSEDWFLTGGICFVLLAFAIVVVLTQ